MVRKSLLSLCFLVTIAAVSAQNFQIHYDMGKDRSYFTTTFEMFKPDAWGNTFFFVDFDYNSNDVKGVSLAYMEIARALRFWDNPFAFQVEYNGGFGQFMPGGAYQINDAWLTGGQYTWNTSDYSRLFTLQTQYKYIRGKHDASFQITGVWVVHFLERKLTFTGFADFWREDMVFGDDVTKFVFLAEPQLWYNFSPHFSIGSEIEVSSNFANNKGFMVNPTAAIRWTF